MVFLSGLLWALFVNGSGGKEISGELRWGPQPCALQTPQVHLDLEGGNRLEAAFMTLGRGALPDSRRIGAGVPLRHSFPGRGAVALLDFRQS